MICLFCLLFCLFLSGLFLASSENEARGQRGIKFWVPGGFPLGNQTKPNQCSVNNTLIITVQELVGAATTFLRPPTTQNAGPGCGLDRHLHRASSKKHALCRRTPTSALLPLRPSARNVRDYLPQASHHDSRLREEQEQEKQTQLEGQEAAPPEEPTRRAHSPHASTTGQPRRQTRRNSSAVRPRTEHRDHRGMP